MMFNPIPKPNSIPNPSPIHNPNCNPNPNPEQNLNSYPNLIPNPFQIHIQILNLISIQIQIKY